MDRHVIANMGAELGATTTVFPADDQVRSFLRAHGREEEFTEITADDSAAYDEHDEIDLSRLEPLIARPSSPGNVVPVAEAAGEEVHQVVVGSSANPGLRDFAIVAAIVAGRQVHPRVSFDINPTSRQMLVDLTQMGAVTGLLSAGARLHQAGCLGCIGMGQAPAVGRNSLRTFPRNFPGRSGTAEDSVWLCSPETAAAAALTGCITDPRQLPELLGIEYPAVSLPAQASTGTSMLEPPLSPEQSCTVDLVKAPSIGSLPEFDPLPESLELPVALKAGDDVSTDEILPAGAQALPYRSNVAKLAEFAFGRTDEDYPERARKAGQHAIAGGANYGQGSSREHAAIVPRYLGLRLVIAKSYARIHWQNLVNFGVLPLEFSDPDDYEDIHQGDQLVIGNAREILAGGAQIEVRNASTSRAYRLRHRLSPRQVEVVLAGGLIPLLAR
jgi:aconitate hydratase